MNKGNGWGGSGGNTKALEAEMAQFATNIKSFGVDSSNDDNTSLFQSALDHKGYLILNVAGTYKINGTLLIDSDTTLCLGEGVIIKQTLIGRNLLRNTNPSEGNSNITIIGGAWDYNNPTITAITPHETHAIVLQNIENLKIDFVTVLNAQKYAWLVADVKHLSATNLTFNTNSDGFHMMGPIDYAYINNVYGITGDNMVAMTIGDYATYEISRGNMTNVTISNIYCDSGFEPVRLVGNTDYYFDKITIEKIYGKVKAGGGRALSIIQDTNLVYTDVKNIKIKDVYCVTSGVEQILINCMNGDNIQLENICSSDPSNTMIKIGSDADIKNIVIRDITSAKESTANTIFVVGDVDILKVYGATSTHIVASTAQCIRIDTLSTIDWLIIDGIYQRYGTDCISNSGVLNKLTISNFDIANVQRMMLNGKGNVSAVISNGNISYTSRFVSNQASTDSSELRITASGVIFPNDTGSRFYKSGVGTISVNGIDFRAKDVAELTPRDGDIIYNTLAGFGTGVGLYLRDTGAWRKI